MSLARPCKLYDDQFRFAGLIIWDIFSNNHEVILQDGTVANIGSWRGSGRVIGDVLNGMELSKVEYGYLDFYMGTFLEDSVDDEILVPYYRRAFDLLKILQCDWDYSFPGTYLISPVSSASKSEEVDKVDYDPQVFAEKELAAAKKKAELDKFRQLLDDIEDEEKEDALYKRPPAIIRAYKEEFGHWPDGWPPV